MNKLLSIFAIMLLAACNPASEKKSDSTAEAVLDALSEIKVPVYAWLGGPGDATDEEIMENFTDLKNKGIVGLMYNGGQDPETYQRVGGIAKEVGLEFHTWIPTMVQGENPKLDPELYAVNGLGESAFEKPAYVDYYKLSQP